MKRIAVGAACVLAVGTGAVGAALATAGGDNSQSTNARGTYDITVENLSSGQPLSPPLVVGHDRRATIWKNGTIASHPVAAIAEDANNAPAIQVLRRYRGVQFARTGVDAGASDAAPIPPGESQTYRVRVPSNRTSHVSLITMLVNTNDAFTGLSSYRLRNGTRVLTRPAYDGGSEVNNQMSSHIPGPVGGNAFVREPEGKLIRRHPGLRPGVGDVKPSDAPFNRNRVARITIERVG